MQMQSNAINVSYGNLVFQSKRPYLEGGKWLSHAGRELANLKTRRGLELGQNYCENHYLTANK